MRMRNVIDAAPTAATSKEVEYVGSMDGPIRRRRCTAVKGQPTLDAWSTAGGAILHGRNANDGGLTSDRAWKGMGVVAVTADLAQLLDKEWEDRSLAEILKAPVSALQGVSEGDADLLRQAFNIKTVGDLGKNKYFQAAQALTVLGEAGAK